MNLVLLKYIYVIVTFVNILEKRKNFFLFHFINKLLTFTLTSYTLWTPDVMLSCLIYCRLNYCSFELSFELYACGTSIRE